MYISTPILIALGVAVLALAAALLMRRGRASRDLIAPPPHLGGMPAKSPFMPAPMPTPASEADDTLEAEVRALIGAGAKLEAIKIVRDRRPGLGLKEAKDWVERVEAGR